MTDYWKSLFISEKHVLKPIFIDPMQDRIKKTPDQSEKHANHDAIALLDDGEFNDYLKGSGHWPFSKIM